LEPREYLVNEFLLFVHCNLPLLITDLMPSSGQGRARRAH
jgi:hypothetical protein